jgi:hypothetical protein
MKDSELAHSNPKNQEPSGTAAGGMCLASGMSEGVTDARNNLIAGFGSCACWCAAAVAA